MRHTKHGPCCRLLPGKPNNRSQRGEGDKLRAMRFSHPFNVASRLAVTNGTIKGRVSANGKPAPARSITFNVPAPKLARKSGTPCHELGGSTHCNPWRRVYIDSGEQITKRINAKGKITMHPNAYGKDPQNRMLTVNEVGQVLHVHPTTIRRWEKQGLLKSHRLGPKGNVRFERQDIAAFVDATSRPGGGEELIM